MRMEVHEFLRRRTVIYGEAGSGKTRLLADILAGLRAVLNPFDITVVDLAPERIGEVGGPLTVYADTSGIRYLRPARIYAPRLMACNAEDLRRYVALNVEEARKHLQAYSSSPTAVLAVNDATIFLHGAEVNELISYAAKASTFVATAYYGEKLSEDYGTGLSTLERRRVEELLKHVDVRLRLNSDLKA
ncbi:MAG: hypothetical protein QXS57_04670 [Candidatus Caldarchaeum sp.]